MAEGNKTNSPNLPSNASSSPPNDDPEDNDAPEVEDDADEASSAATSSSNSPSLGGATANPPERGSKAAANHNGARTTRQPHNRGASNQSSSGCVNANHGRSHSRNSHRDHHHHHRERHHRERQRAPTSRSRERDAASNASHQGLEEPHEPEGDPEPESERAANSAPQGDNNPANSHPEPLAPSLGAAITSALAGAPSAPIPPPNHANVQYNWQAGKSSVRERLAFMFNNETLADVHFLVGKGGNVQRIPAHRFVLAIGSAVFDAMFNGGMATKSGEVELPDVEPAAFLAMLKFLYSDEVHIGPETVMTTLYTAKKYAVPALEQACVDFLKRNLCSENAFMLLTQARLFDESQLAALCLESIDKNTSEALSAEGFLDIDQETLAVVLERDTLGIRECKLFTSAVRWSEAECMRQSMAINATNQRQVMGRALQLIRFPLMTVEEFAMGSAQTGILTDREVVELFLHFTVNPKPSVHFLDTPRCCLTGKEQVVSRFCQIESRWGYSGTSDRIRFMVNRRIFVVGFGLYGSIHGPAEYSVNIQILHTDSGRVCGQNDTTFQCDGTNTTFRVMFKEPIEIQHNASFTACATLKGPDSYYGTKGLRKVTHESVTSGKVTFQFTYAAGNNNGTSVEDGQIPEIIFYT